MIFKLLAALTISISFAFTGTSFNYVPLKAESSPQQSYFTELYIDLSLNDKFKEVGSNPYIVCSEHNYPLSLINNYIYKSEATFSGGQVIEIHCYEGSYKSESITLKETDYNYLAIGNDYKLKGFGYYQDKKINPGATYETQRVWLFNPVNEEKDEWGKDIVNTVMYTYKNGTYLMDMESVTNSFNGYIYYYADVPYELTSIHFLRTASSKDHNYIIYKDAYIPSLTYGVCYFADVEDFTSISIGVVPSATAVMLSKVVESYLTYGKDDSNGATTSTMKNVYHTFFASKSATSDELKSIKILDYTGYAANGNSYVGLVKNSSYSVNEKWNTMCSQAGIDPNTGEIRTFSFGWLASEEFRMAILVGGTALLLVGGLVFIYFRKKRLKVME